MGRLLFILFGYIHLQACAQPKTAADTFDIIKYTAPKAGKKAKQMAHSLSLKKQPEASV